MNVRKTLFILVGVVALSAPLEVFGSGIIINEVLFNSHGDDTGHEWVELYNSDDKGKDISGWQLYPDGISYFIFEQGTKIDSGKFLVIHLRSQGVQSAADLYQSSASGNMGNTSGSIALFSGNPRGKETIKDFVEWGKGGQTWEGSAVDAGLWEKGTSINLNSFSEGNALALKNDGNRGGRNAWMITLSPTPGSLNHITSSQESSLLPSQNQIAAAVSLINQSSQTSVAENQKEETGSNPAQVSGVLLGRDGSRNQETPHTTTPSSSSKVIKPPSSEKEMKTSESLAIQSSFLSNGQERDNKEQGDAKNILAARGMSNISSALFLGGAIGISLLAAVGFFFVKTFFF